MERGAVQLGALLTSVGLLAGGATIGFTGQRVFNDDPSTETTAIVRPSTEVPGYDCPGGSVAMVLNHGDQVLATGVHEDDDDWVRVRNPEDPSQELWIRAPQIETDDGLGDLDAVGCGEVTDTDADVDPDEVAAPSDGATTTTDPDESTTSTTDPNESTTTSSTRPGQTTSSTRPGQTTSSTATTKPGQTTTTKPPGTTTSTTAGPDNTPPTVGTISRNPTLIWENHHLGTACASNSPTTSEISTTATDSGSGVSFVTMSWFVEDEHGTTVDQGSDKMQKSGNTYSRTLGPFGGDLIAADGADGTIYVVLQAQDNEGNKSPLKTTTVALRDCTFG